MATVPGELTSHRIGQNRLSAPIVGRTALVRLSDQRDDRCMTIETHACPYCELIFRYHNEVKDHILHDHPEHADVVATIEPHEMPHD